MAIITYVPQTGYDNTQHGIINNGSGGSFDVGAALVAGSGVITVDTSITPNLPGALDSYPGVRRQSTSPGTPVTTDITGSPIFHSQGSGVGKIPVQNADGTWSPASVSGVSNTLAGLTDTTITSPAFNQVLTYNGTKWINQAPSGGGTALVSLTDVTITTPTTNQVLTYNGSRWVNQAAAGGGSTSLAGLTDVTIASPSTNQVLTWSGTRWINQSPSGGSGSLAGLTDASITAPANNQVLTYNSGTTKWINATPPNTLAGDTDVTITSPTNNQVLTYNTASSKWINATPTTGVTTLAALTDVTVTTPSTNQVLTYNGTRWVNQAPSGGSGSLAGLTDVTIASPTNNQILTYNSGTTKWTNQTPTAQTLASDTDVTITSPTTNQVLTYNGTRWVNQAPSGGSGSLAGLTDVTISGPTNGQVLTYNSGTTKWTNQASSGGSGQTVVTDTPEAHGAARNGSTDDTAAIQAAINNVVTTAVANGSNYGEVIFSAGIYQLTSAPGGHGTPTFASAQITLPLIPSGTTSQKFTLKLKGLADGGTALPHWGQTVGQKSGAVLRTTATGTNDTTNGVPAVIGGPTNEQGYGGGSGNAWSNMLVIVDGLTIVSSTANPTMSGFNFEGLLEAKIISAGYMADASPATMGGFITTPSNFTHQWTFGLKMPTTNNNDLSIVQDWSCEGAWYSIWIGEHTHVYDMRSVYCGWGIMLDNRAGTPHWSQIDFASVEVGINTMGLVTNANYKINIGMIDQESVGPIWDGNSNIIGTVTIGANQTSQHGSLSAFPFNQYLGGSAGSVGQQMRLYNADAQAGGVQANPTVPASGTPLANQFLRDAMVNISGGVGVTITVDGAPTGLSSGTFFVPSNRYITLTYSVAPIWTWILI